MFSEFWKRENNLLAYEWDVLKFENEEIDLPDYELKREKIQNKIKMPNGLKKFFYTNEQFFKILLSYTVLFLMVNSKNIYLFFYFYLFF